MAFQLSPEALRSPGWHETRAHLEKRLEQLRDELESPSCRNPKHIRGQIAMIRELLKVERPPPQFQQPSPGHIA